MAKSRSGAATARCGTEEPLMVAFADLAALFDELRGAVAESSSEPLGPSRPAEDYLPTQAVLTQRFTATPTEARALLTQMLTGTLPRWSAVQAGGIAELERIQEHAQAMAGTAVTVPPGLSYRYNDYAFRLSLDI